MGQSSSITSTETGECDSTSSTETWECDSTSSTETWECDSTSSTETWDSQNEIQREPLNFLLMGKTGHGKSALGNSILGCKFFDVSGNVNSQTRDVASGNSEFENYSLKVVDGPGLEDTEFDKLKDTESAIQTMATALIKCSEGVDAFLFVYRLGNRFTAEELLVLETLKGIFGKDYFKHVIVVLTWGDQFPGMKEEVDFVGTFDDWCQKQTGPFLELYKSCQRRFVLFNNRETEEERQISQREQLVTLAHHLKSLHGRYTSDSFRLVAAERERMIITLKEPILKEEYQKQAGLIVSKMQRYIKDSRPEIRAEIEKAIHKLKREIKTEDKGHGLLKHLMKTVLLLEKNLQYVDAIRDLLQEFENIRRASTVWSKVCHACQIGVKSVALSTYRH